MTARRRSSTPPTAMPTMRKGNRRSQMKGYNTRASSASGQHSTNRMHHKMKVTGPPLAGYYGAEDGKVPCLLTLRVLAVVQVHKAATLPVGLERRFCRRNDPERLAAEGQIN